MLTLTLALTKAAAEDIVGTCGSSSDDEEEEQNLTLTLTLTLTLNLIPNCDRRPILTIFLLPPSWTQQLSMIGSAANSDVTCCLYGTATHHHVSPVGKPRGKRKSAQNA